MKLETCVNCVYHLIHDEKEVSCYHSDDIVHVDIMSLESGEKEIAGCPRERCGAMH